MTEYDVIVHDSSFVELLKCGNTFCHTTKNKVLIKDYMN